MGITFLRGLMMKNNWLFISQVNQIGIQGIQNEKRPELELED